MGRSSLCREAAPTEGTPLRRPPADRPSRSCGRVRGRPCASEVRPSPEAGIGLLVRRTSIVLIIVEPQIVFPSDDTLDVGVARESNGGLPVLTGLGVRETQQHPAEDLDYDAGSRFPVGGGDLDADGARRLQNDAEGSVSWPGSAWPASWDRRHRSASGPGSRPAERASKRSSAKRAGSAHRARSRPSSCPVTRETKETCTPANGFPSESTVMPST